MSIRVRRTGLFLVVAAALFTLLLASAAEAVDRYSMSGRYASKRGQFINIPLGGTVACPDLVEQSNVYNFGAVGTPVNATPPITFWIAFPGPPAVNPHPVQANATCVNGGAQVVSSVGGAAVFGTGAAKSFTLPVGAFQRPLPSPAGLNVVAVPVMAVQQLATSWGVSGPVPVSVITNGPDARTNASFYNPTTPNLAPWRVFQPQAWQNQTGRMGAGFTVCFNRLRTVPPPYGPCSLISQGSNLLARYTAKPNAFGGTMTMLLTVGPNAGSVAVRSGPGVPAGGGLLINPLANSGTALGGRGYLATRIAAGTTGGPSMNPMFVPRYANFKTSLGGSGLTAANGLVTAVTGPQAPFPVAAQTNMPLPFTTGTVFVRRTGFDPGGAVTFNTHTAMGSDNRDAAGGGNIVLVSGAMGVSTGAKTPAIDIMSLEFVPEPSAALLLFAGGLGLVGLDRVRQRRG